MTPLECVVERRVIAIVRGMAPEHILRLGSALEECGVGLMEITYNQSAPDSWRGTARAIEAAAREFGDRLMIGAGTVITPEQVRMTLEAGGRYIVTPATQPEIIRLGRSLGLGLFPGALTPTEILTAFESGADAVKVFPAGAFGPGYIRALRAPLSHIPLIAVGGVDAGNAGEFIRAGCAGVGVGGHLVNKEWIEGGRWDRITEAARALTQAARG